MRCATCSFTWSALMVGTAFLVSGCKDSPTSPPTDKPVLAAVPADGNGTRQVIAIHQDFPGFGTCPNGATLDIRADGWVQIRSFPESHNPQVELDVYHVVHTWTNSAGETFVDSEIGPDHYYLDKDGNLIIASIGHNSYSGIFGRLVINLTTGEVLFATGPGFPDHLALACAALT